MDKRPIIGIFLIFIVLILWTLLITPRDKKDRVKPVSKTEEVEREHAVSPPGSSSTIVSGIPDVGQVEEILDTVETRVARIIISRIGASIRAVKLKNYKGPGGGWVELIPENERTLCGAMGDSVFSNEVFELVDRTPLTLAYEFNSERGKSGLGNPSHIVYRFSDTSYAFNLTVKLPAVSKYRLWWNSGLRTTEKSKEEELRYFGGIVRLGGTVVVKNLNSLDTVPTGEPGTIEWVGVKNKYFLGAIVPLVETDNYLMSKATPTKVGGGCMRGCMPVGEVNPEDIKVRVALTTQASETHKFKIYVGPLDYDILRGVGFGLEDACYFGFKWIRPISRLFLKVLLGLHKFIPNYGVVIIVFSLILSILFFPLTKTSQKSAINMQKLQPKLQELQKRYAKDPKRLNQATMELYRNQGISPLSGCLPLFIQMPVFFALYAILDTTIALRGAVFIPGWIEDLSQHDPYYALPILMGGMMFLQQKLQSKGAVTTQMQQQQKMMMYFMPVMFTFIFMRFPAGLVLYWFVYNIFSFIQTYLLMPKGGKWQVASKKSK